MDKIWGGLDCVSVNFERTSGQIWDVCRLDLGRFACEKMEKWWDGE